MTTREDAKYPESASIQERARRVMPGGGRAAGRPYALRYAQGRGSRLTDVDGIEYVDYVSGWSTLVLGHAPDLVMERVEQQLRTGVHFGSMTDVEVELAERIVRLLPSVDMVKFCTTGSESVHAALGLARLVTGRHRVIKFEGHLHGWVSPMPVNTNFDPPFDGVPIGPPGWAPSADVEICRWNRLDEVAAVLSRPDHDVAAVIMEPIALDGGILPIDVDFLRAVRELCDRDGVMLVFDEIVTGFRVALGGAQERLGVWPDITTVAKAFASGFPISAVGARQEVWDAADRLGFRLSGGTFSGYSLCCAAGCGSLETLERGKDVIYPRFEELSSRLARGLEEAAAALGVPLVVHHCGPVLYSLWGVEPPVETYAQVCSGNFEATRIWDEEMVRRGVTSLNGSRWYMNAAHSAADVDHTIQVGAEALAATLERLG